jgi:phytoene dehydrogenase-like protein
MPDGLTEQQVAALPDRCTEPAAPAGAADPGVSDAIVIGSGPNGLAAAIRLARAGRSVIVLEAAEHPGGAVRTEELTLPGFRHDTFSSVYPAAVASPVFDSMPLSERGLEWVHPSACMAHPLPGGEAAVLYRDLEATARSLGSKLKRAWDLISGNF